MKRLLQMTALVFAVSVLTAACTSTKKTAVATRNDLKGSWMVASVEVEGLDGTNVKITSFDDVDLKCFEGSQWYLPNNGYGNYNISQSGCRPGERRIVWSQDVKNGVTYLGFKHLDDLKNNQAKSVTDGYRLEVVSYDKDRFTAKSPVNFEGRTIYVVYHFDKR